MSEYRYRLTSTSHSSHRFGPCTVCGEHASEVFIQVEEKRFHLDANDVAMIPSERVRAEKIASGGWGWTQYECHTIFGHELCLIGRRR